MSWHFSAAMGGGFSEANSSAGTVFAPWSELPFAPDDSCSAKMKATCHRSPFGTMFVPSTDAAGEALLNWFLEDSRARASALPAMDPDWITKSRHFGPNRPASLASLKPPQSGLRTHQRSLFEEGFESLETLPRWGMIVGGELYPLPTPSGLTALRASITSESGSGLPERLPTPIAHDAKIGLPGQGTRDRGGRSSSLSVSVRVPTPTATRGGVDSTKEARGSTTGHNLATVVRVPTPKSEDGQCAGGHRDKNDTLYGLICRPKRVPTPTSTFLNTTNHNPQEGAKGRPALGALVKRIPTPTTQDASNNGPPSQQERNTKPLNAEVGGPLNPDWVEWLMGWPIGWTDSKPLETDKFQLWLNSHGKF